MFRQMRIINIKTRQCKSIDIYDYTPTQLNAIAAFYDGHSDYAIERI